MKNPEPRYAPGTPPEHRLRPIAHDGLRYWVAWFMLRLLMFPACVLIYRVFHRLEVHGLENLEKVDGRSFLLCPNHTSAWDSPVSTIYPFSTWSRLLDTSAYFTVLGAPENLKFRFVQYFFIWMGVTPVDRKAGIEQFSLQDAMRVLQAGDRNVCLGIYPEGTRSKTGRMAKKGKLGAGWFARRAKVPVVPVYHRGFPDLPGFRKKVVLWIGEPLELEHLHEMPDDPPTWNLATKEIMAVLHAMEARYNPPEPDDPGSGSADA